MAEKEQEKKVNKLRNEIKDRGEKKVSSLTDIEEPKEAASEKANRRRTSFEKPSEEVNEPKAEKKNREKKADTPPKAKAPKVNPVTAFITRIRENERLHKVTGAFLLFIAAP